jgi:hypothetical protein
VQRIGHWFRRDLRQTDSTAPTEAHRQSEHAFAVSSFERACCTVPHVGAVRRQGPALATAPDKCVPEPRKEPLLVPGYLSRSVLHEKQRPETLALFQRIGR